MRWIDWQADLIRRVFTPINQTRLGVVMLDLGIIFAVGWPVIAPSEPPLIYEMSALALIFGGIGVIVTGVLAEDTGEAADEVERHHPEPSSVPRMSLNEWPWHVHRNTHTDGYVLHEHGGLAHDNHRHDEDPALDEAEVPEVQS